MGVWHRAGFKPDWACSANNVGTAHKYSDINVQKLTIYSALQLYAALLLLHLPDLRHGFLNFQALYRHLNMPTLSRCRGPHKPETVAVLSDMLWPVGAPVVGASVRPNMLNMPKSASGFVEAGNIFSSPTVCHSYPVCSSSIQLDNDDDTPRWSHVAYRLVCLSTLPLNCDEIILHCVVLSWVAKQSMQRSSTITADVSFIYLSINLFIYFRFAHTLCHSQKQWGIASVDKSRVTAGRHDRTQQI